MSELVKKFCNEFDDLQDYDILTQMSQPTQRIFIFYAHKKLEQKNDDRGYKIAKEVINYFNPFPKKYLPKIENEGNTCWVSTSIWFAGSMARFMNMLHDHLGIPMALFDISEVMIQTSDDKKDRSYLDDLLMNRDIISCIVSDDNYIQGEQDDVSRNWDSILDATPKLIKEQLFYHTIPYTKRNITTYEGDGTMSKEDITYLHEHLVNQLKEELRVMDNDNLAVNEYLRDVFNIKANIFSPIKALPAKFWPTIYEYHTGEYDANIINRDRFCGKVKGYEEVSRLICFLTDLRKNILNLRNNIGNTGEVKKEINWGINLPVSEFQSIQEYMNKIPIASDERVSEFDHYNIVYSQRIEYKFKHKPYIVIKLNFDMDNYGDADIPRRGDFTVDKDITLDGDDYTLTSVCMKSGGADGGHWWALVRKDNDSFLKYDDMDNDKLSVKNMKYINKFGKKPYPSLLCYTLVE